MLFFCSYAPRIKKAKKTITQIIVFLALRFLFFQVISRKITIHSIDIITLKFNNIAPNASKESCK